MVYFLDDDNTASPHLFAEIRKVKTGIQRWNRRVERKHEDAGICVIVRVCVCVCVCVYV